jgi:hypothetical protein
MAQVLESSGYAYKKAADNVSVVTFKVKQTADIKTQSEQQALHGPIRNHRKKQANHREASDDREI